MPHPTRISAQNSQYSSTGVGFHIRNDLNALTTAIYPLFPSQALALRRAHTCMCARIAAIRLLFSIRLRHQSDPKSRPNRKHFRCTLSTTYPHLLAKFTTATIQQPQSDHTTTARPHRHDYAATKQHPTNDPANPNQRTGKTCETTTTRQQNHTHTTATTPTSRPKNHPISLPVHLRFTCESLAPARHHFPILAAYNQGTIQPHLNHIHSTTESTNQADRIKQPSDPTRPNHAT